MLGVGTIGLGTTLMNMVGFRPSFVESGGFEMAWACLCHRARVIRALILCVLLAYVTFLVAVSAFHLPSLSAVAMVIAGIGGVTTLSLLVVRFLAPLPERQAAAARLWDSALRKTMLDLPAHAACGEQMLERVARTWLIDHGVDVEAFVAVGEHSSQPVSVIMHATELLAT